MSVQNSRTGKRQQLALAATARAADFRFPNMGEGDPLVVTDTDSAGNTGKPCGFCFDSKEKDGKDTRPPLAVRLGGFNF